MIKRNKININKIKIKICRKFNRKQILISDTNKCSNTHRILHFILFYFIFDSKKQSFIVLSPQG